jgi:hypothetical protein
MNFELLGNPVAIIKKEGQRQSPIVSVSDRNIARNKFNTLKLGPDDGKFQVIPNPETERQILYVTGASGSGKSYFTRMYCQEFSKMFPKRPIILFSSITDDSSIDEIKGLKRIKLCEEFLNEDFDINDFKDTMVIFDDCDCISDKKTKLKITSILNMVLETGRHTNTYCVVTSHLPTAGNDTKRILNESHSITFFPQSLGGRSLKYLLENYLGLDRDQIKRVKKLKSRWVSVMKSYPKVVVSESEIYTLNNDDDEEEHSNSPLQFAEAVAVPEQSSGAPPLSLKKVGKNTKK